MTYERFRSIHFLLGESELLLKNFKEERERLNSIPHHVIQMRGFSYRIPKDDLYAQLDAKEAAETEINHALRKEAGIEL